jgi:hypothetical protein
VNRRGALATFAAVLAGPLARGSVALAQSVPQAPAVERVIGKVGRNHGHALVVSVADVLAGVPKTYDINGGSGHSHEVTLSAADFATLRAGGVVRMAASRYQGRGHLHRILVKTAPAVDPPDAVPVVDVVIGGKDDHELVIGAPQMAAKVDVTFDIQGIAAHTHSITVTAADFQKLAAGQEVHMTSTVGDDHTHLVFLRYPLKKS